jgi:hypothetical protein
MRPLTIITVDPGHATLVDAVRYHPGGVHIEYSRRQKRRHNLKKKLALNDRTHFSLTNVHWQAVCGRRGTQKRIQDLISRMGIHPAGHWHTVSKLVPRLYKCRLHELSSCPAC